ncbi:MAG: heme NO-binding domain-containing protein [Sulfuricurvum sp.]|nr:heme NO-binding domain-containing protein [Sulfuricurvum sp.]
MRGVIFNSFLEYLENKQDYSFVDELIEEAALINDGSFADAGLYPDEELMRLMELASKKLECKVGCCWEEFGEWLFATLFSKFNTLYSGDTYRQSMIHNAFDFIVMLNTIHYKEVVKLYPDSLFPHFDIIRRTDDELQICYRSKRNLHHLAKGMLMGCGKYFNESLHIQMHPPKSDSAVLFTITKAA